MSIEYLAHTADIRMRIQAKTLEGLFKDAVRGMGNILKEGFCEQTHRVDLKIMIELEATGYTYLLIDFLSEVLSNAYIEHVVFWNIEIIDLSEFKIKAKLTGTQIETYDEDIKAVTYHEANVTQNNEDYWETCIIFDV